MYCAVHFGTGYIDTDRAIATCYRYNLYIARVMRGEIERQTKTVSEEKKSEEDMV